MARPKVSHAEKKSVRFTFRLTRKEKQELFQLAEISGCTPANLIHDKLFKGRFPSAKAARVDVGIYLELKKIGVNVNQLAKRVNSGKTLTGVPDILQALLAQQDKIIRILISDSDSENR